MLRWIRNSFLYGVAVVLPFAVTLWLVVAIVGFIDNQVIPLLPAQMQDIARQIPGAGVMFAVVALTIFGALAANLIGRFFVREGERFVERLPLVRSVYGGAKQLFKQVAAPERTSFQEAVLVEFPRPGCWVIGFVTNDDTAEVTGPIGDDMVAVYIPQAPIPTTGFLHYLPRSALKPCGLSTEDALKRIFSLGIIKADHADADAAAPK